MVLEKVSSGKDLRKLNFEELNRLCEELRQFIVDTVSLTGGHLASNLGDIELAVALEYVFDTTVDHLIYDVGHQSYVHKIIQGRKDKFHTLRTLGGISGFPKREEDISDCFNTGHASNSIAAAFGFAKARDLLGEKYHVIAVIGDGSLTGGEAFEALDLAGCSDTDLLIILNDNNMSIGSNIGGISKYLNRIRLSDSYLDTKTGLKSFLKKVPFVGKPIYTFLDKTKKYFKHLILKKGSFFQSLGLNYYGMIDGHNIEELINTLTALKEVEGPKILHVSTIKGKGYEPAQKDPTAFHGISSFNKETGKLKASKAYTFTQAFGDSIVSLARENEKVCAITAAMPDGTGLVNFSREFPNRFFDVGIAEPTAVTMASAMALEGLRPVVAIYSSFLQRAYDQILMDAALQDAPVVFAIDRSGVVGEDGPTHHGMFDLSYLNTIPNLTILVPRNPKILKEMLEFAVSQTTGPVAIRYPKGAAPEVSDEPSFELGSGRLFKEGKDGLIISCGPQCYEALKVSDRLMEEGYSIGVYDVETFKPFNYAKLDTFLQKYPLIVSIEENSSMGGLSSVISEEIALLGLQKSFLSFSLEDNFIESGSRAELLKEYCLDEEGIYSKLSSYLRGK